MYWFGHSRILNEIKAYHHAPINPNQHIRSNFFQIPNISSFSKMSAVKEKIDTLLQEKKVVVISKSYCPFCKKAKQVLAKYNIPKEHIAILEIENDSSCEEIQKYMQVLTGGRSVPRVFIGGKCIGGGDETMALHNKGKLEPLLKNVGALA